MNYANIIFSFFFVFSFNKFSNAQEIKDWQRSNRSSFYDFGQGYVSAELYKATISKNLKEDYNENIININIPGGLLVYKKSKNNIFYPIKLDLTRKGKLILEIENGVSTPGSIKSIFGGPLSEKNDTLTYKGDAEICDDNYIFVFKEGLLAKAEWNWCTD